MLDDQKKSWPGWTWTYCFRSGGGMNWRNWSQKTYGSKCFRTYVLRWMYLSQDLKMNAIRWTSKLLAIFVWLASGWCWRVLLLLLLLRYSWYMLVYVGTIFPDFLGFPVCWCFLIVTNRKGVSFADACKCKMSMDSQNRCSSMLNKMPHQWLCWVYHLFNHP